MAAWSQPDGESPSTSEPLQDQMEGVTLLHKTERVWLVRVGRSSHRRARDGPGVSQNPKRSRIKSKFETNNRKITKASRIEPRIRKKKQAVVVDTFSLFPLKEQQYGEQVMHLSNIHYWG